MAQCHTIFHQMLKLIPRHHFDKLEAEHGTGRKARSVTPGSQLVPLLSMQPTARGSLWQGIAGLKYRIKNSTIWESSRWPAPPLATPTISAPPPSFTRCLP